MTICGTPIESTKHKNMRGLVIIIRHTYIYIIHSICTKGLSLIQHSCTQVPTIQLYTCTNYTAVHMYQQYSTCTNNTAVTVHMYQQYSCTHVSIFWKLQSNKLYALKYIQLCLQWVWQWLRRWATRRQWSSPKVPKTVHPYTKPTPICYTANTRTQTE